MSNIEHGRFLEHIQNIPAYCKDYNTDRLTLVTGIPGAGKSGVTHVAMRLMDPKFDPELQCHWTVPRYVSAEFKLPKYRPIRMDELVKAGTNYRFMSGDVTAFADRIYINRELCHPQFALHPDFNTISPILKEGRAWEHWKVLKRFRDHAVVKVEQLRDEEHVFPTPRTLFRGTLPKPKGRLWELENELKHRFGRSQGSGTLDFEDQYLRVKERMHQDLALYH